MTDPDNTATAGGARGIPGRPARHQGGDMSERVSGEWPVDEPVDLVPEDLYLKRAAERGRHEIVLGSIRAHLEEQPTAIAVQSTVRHWIADVIAIGDEVAKAKRTPG